MCLKVPDSDLSVASLMDLLWSTARNQLFTRIARFWRPQ
jgi:hypothetical protein